MSGNLGGWTGIVLLVVVLVLFGAPKLPGLAKSLGESLKIFKSEVRPGSDSPEHDDAAAGSESSESSQK
jgi:sec-independent protein translocase protein TatA